MSERCDHDGGPAFPVLYPVGASGCDGMTLRDWFAGMAIANNAAFMCGESPENVSREANDHAKAAYELADAMLRERERER